MADTELAVIDQQESKVTVTTFSGEVAAVNSIFQRHVTESVWTLLTTIVGNDTEIDIALTSGVYDFYVKGFDDPNFSVSAPLRLAVTSGVGTKMNDIIDAMIDEINGDGFVDFYGQDITVTKEYPPHFENIQVGEIKIVPENSFPVEGTSQIDDLHYGITCIICDRVQSADQMQQHLWIRRKLQRLFSARKLPIIPFAYVESISDSVVYDPGDLGDGVFISPVVFNWISREARGESEASPNETNTYFLLVDSTGRYLTEESLDLLTERPLT